MPLLFTVGKDDARVAADRARKRSGRHCSAPPRDRRHTQRGTRARATVFYGFTRRAYGITNQAEEGLTVLAEALKIAEQRGERFYDAELYRLKGTLTLQSQASLRQVKTGQESRRHRSPTPDPRSPRRSRRMFHQALEIARSQQAKSLELRAADES